MMVRLNVEPSRDGKCFVVMLNGTAVACAKEYLDASTTAWAIESQEYRRLAKHWGNFNDSIGGVRQ